MLELIVKTNIKTPIEYFKDSKYLEKLTLYSKTTKEYITVINNK